MRIFQLLSRLSLFTLLLVLFHDIADAQSSSAPFYFYKDVPINLLQPLDGSSSTSLPAEPGIGILYTYFNYAWPWVIGSAAGIGVLQALVGGIQIMLSGGKAGKDEGKTRLQWALAGLLMVGLAGLILETLNPLFYTQV